MFLRKSCKQDPKFKQNSKPFWWLHSERWSGVHSPSNGKKFKGYSKKIFIKNEALYLIHCDTLLQNATDIIVKWSLLNYVHRALLRLTCLRAFLSYAPLCLCTLLTSFIYLARLFHALFAPYLCTFKSF